MRRASRRVPHPNEPGEFCPFPLDKPCPTFALMNTTITRLATAGASLVLTAGALAALLHAMRRPSGGLFAALLVLGARTHLYEGAGVDPVVHGVRTAAAPWAMSRSSSPSPPRWARPSPGSCSSSARGA